MRGLWCGREAAEEPQGEGAGGAEAEDAERDVQQRAVPARCQAQDGGLIDSRCRFSSTSLKSPASGRASLPSVIEGLTIELVDRAGLREEAELSDVPALMRGTGINLIIAGILSMAFMGFAGLFSSV